MGNKIDDFTHNLSQKPKSLKQNYWMKWFNKHETPKSHNNRYISFIMGKRKWIYIIKSDKIYKYYNDNKNLTSISANIEVFKKFLQKKKFYIKKKFLYKKQNN